MKKYLYFCAVLVILLFGATSALAQFPRSSSLQPPPPNIGKSVVPNTEPSNHGLSPEYNVQNNQSSSQSSPVGNIMSHIFSATSHIANVKGGGAWLDYTILFVVMAIIIALIFLYFKK